MESKVAIVPEQVIQNLEETFNGTVFEGVTEELTDIEVTELDQASNFDYSEKFTVFGKKEYLYLNNTSEEITFYDSFTFAVEFLQDLAQIIETEFQSSQEVIEYLSDNNLLEFFEIDSDSEFSPIDTWGGVDTEDRDKYTIEIAQVLYELSLDIEFTRNLWEWATDIETGYYFVYEDDEYNRIVGKITDISYKSNDFDNDPLTKENAEYKFTFEIIETNMEEDDGILQEKQLTPRLQNDVTFYKENPVNN